VGHRRADAGGLETRPKRANFLLVQRPAPPLAGILREDLQGFASVGDGAIDGLGQSARDGHVGTDAHSEREYRFHREVYSCPRLVFSYS
jgi:hypothetical protein